MGVVGVEVDFIYFTCFNGTFRTHRSRGAPAPRAVLRPIRDFPFPAANA